LDNSIRTEAGLIVPAVGGHPQASRISPRRHQARPAVHGDMETENIAILMVCKECKHVSQQGGNSSGQSSEFETSGGGNRVSDREVSVEGRLLVDQQQPAGLETAF
jgi:hypothetical protein